MDIGSGLKWVALIGLAVVVGVISLVYFESGPGEGEREFRKSQEALQQAKSWHYTRKWGGAMGTQEDRGEVSCPSSLRLTRHTESGYSVHKENSMELIQVGKDTYVRQTTDSPWTRGEPVLDVAQICAHVSRGEDADTLPAFGYWLKKGVYKKGAKRTIEDAECQEWTAMVPVAVRRPDEEAKVCLGLVDNMPLYHRWSMGEFTFSAWNVPNDIQAPAYVSGTNP